MRQRTAPAAAGIAEASAGKRPAPHRDDEKAGLHKAIGLGAIRTVVQMAASFLSVKITSVYLGPAGIGVLAQLQGFIGLTFGVMSNGVNKGLIRCTAEYGHDPERRRLLVATTARALLLAGVPLSLVIVAAAPLVAAQLLGDVRYTPAVAAFGAVYLCGLFGSALMGMANGAKDYTATTLIDTGYVLAGLLLFAVLSPLYGIAGGLVAAALAPLALLIVALLVTRGKTWFERRHLFAGFSRQDFWRLAAFIPMSAAAAIGEALPQIIVRDTLADHAGMHAVGLLQGVWRLSDIYLNIFIGMFSMYYLPRFAEIAKAAELRREIGRALLHVVPAVAAVSAVIYLLRDLVVTLVFTREFLPMRDLFAWQMFGNVLKMSGWLFGYVLLARISPLQVGIAELAKGAAWIAFAWWLVPAAGSIGAVQSFVATYACYLLATAAWVFLIARRMERKESQ